MASAAGGSPTGSWPGPCGAPPRTTWPSASTARWATSPSAPRGTCSATRRRTGPPPPPKVLESPTAMNRRQLLQAAAGPGATGAAIAAPPPPIPPPITTPITTPPTTSAHDAGFEWLEASAAELQQAMAQGRTSALGLLRAYSERIHRLDAAGPRLARGLELNPHAQAPG